MSTHARKEACDSLFLRLVLLASDLCLVVHHLRNHLREEASSSRVVPKHHSNARPIMKYLVDAIISISSKAFWKKIMMWKPIESSRIYVSLHLLDRTVIYILFEPYCSNIKDAIKETTKVSYFPKAPFSSSRCLTECWMCFLTEIGESRWFATPSWKGLPQRFGLCPWCRRRRTRDWPDG